MLTKFFQLAAALYAGGYRFLAVFLVDAFFSAEVSADFSRYLFWVGLITCFAGLPIASRAQAQEQSLTSIQQITLCLPMLLLAAIGVYFFWEDSIQNFWIIILAGGLISLFEIKRMERAAAGSFLLLTVTGTLSLLLLIAIMFLPFLPADWLTAAIFAGLAIPVILSYVFVPHSITSPITLKQAIKPVGANAISSIIVTGLTFAFPLILIEEFGREHSSAIAQVYAIAAMSFSYPRYLSTGFIVQAKLGKATRKDVATLARKIFIFVVIACVLFASISWLIAPQMLTFLLLFVAMQLSQITLPYNNWWTAHGKEVNVMKLNFISVAILSICIALIYASTTNGEWRGQVILIPFVGYQLLRFFMYSRENIGRSE